MKRQIIVAITGATGAVYGRHLLEVLRDVPDIETHLIVSRAGLVNAATDLQATRDDLHGLADHAYSNRDIGASVASGSFRTDGMIIAPCSVKTLSSIACGLTDNLIARAADVVLKERRRLVLMVRETPLNLVHIRNMATVTEAGAIVAPPVPAFYMQPKSIQDIVHHSVARILDLFDIDAGGINRWQGIANRDSGIDTD
jgi:4-hydroxy-3-polyprenylbenzoate decarboxylase